MSTLLNLPPRLAKWQRELAAAAMAYDLDPLVLAAVVDRESLGGEALRPKGPAGKGDEGHGHGLAQIDDRTHRGFLDAVFPSGAPLWAEAAFNLLYAARLLRDGIRATGSVEGGVCAYNAGVSRASMALAALAEDAPYADKVRALDKRTTGGNYVSDVIERAQHWRRDGGP